MFTKTLPKNARESLAILGKSKCLPIKTYLAGGSGLALYLGHRVSVDFDFFTPELFNQEILAQKLSRHGKFAVTTISPDTLLGTFNGTRFSIFRYQYPRLFKTTNCFDVEVADKRDIAAMKIAAVVNRGTKKDFIDLYFLSKDNISLDDCLKYYGQKYGVLADNLYSIVRSFTYFAEAEESETPMMLKRVSWENTKKFFENEAVLMADKFLKR